MGDTKWSICVHVSCASFEIPLSREAGEKYAINSVNFQYIVTPSSLPQQDRLGARREK